MFRETPTRGISRRDFIKRAVIVGAGAGAAVAFGRLPQALASDPRIVIIGAGLAGVRCAHRLDKFGITSTVYEASARIGGRAFSDTTFFDDGQVAEHGGSFISTEHTRTRNLATSLGLDLEVINGGALAEGEEIYLIDGDFLYRRRSECRLEGRVESVQGRPPGRSLPPIVRHDHPRGVELSNISIPRLVRRFQPGLASHPGRLRPELEAGAVADVDFGE